MSKRRPYSAAGTPVATAAFSSRAPSRCSLRSSSRAVVDDVVDLVEPPAAPARRVVRVLDRDEPRARHVHRRSVAHERAHVVAAEAPRDRADRPRDEPGVDGRAALLGEQDVRVLLGEQLVARLGEDPAGDLVRHRSPSAGRPRPPGRAAPRRAARARARSGPRASARRRPRRSPSPRACRASASSPCPSAGRPCDGIYRCSRGVGRYRVPMDTTLLERSPRRRAGVPAPPGVGVGGARRCGIRRDDERAGRAARAARGGRPVLDADGRARGARARRHGEGAVPHARRPSGRGGAHALPRRAPLGLRLVAVRLPAHVHVLRDGPDALRPQPHRVGDPRPGAPLPPDRARRPRRLHGHGRADAEPRQRRRSGAPAPGPRRHAPAHDGLDRRLASRPAPLRGRGRRADPPRALAPRAERRAAQRAHAGQRALSARGGARRVPPLLRAARGERCSSST